MKIKSFQGGYDKNLCYLLWCEKTNYAALVDPSVEILPVTEFIETHNLLIDKILITHTHYDHIRYLDDIINLYPMAKVIISDNTTISHIPDYKGVNHNDVIMIGENIILTLFTPGHYFDSICYWVKNKNMLFTGDTMFVGRTGRTISGGSNIPDLFNSIYNILLELPKKTIIYPGHHYGFSKTISMDDNIKLSKIFQCNSLKEFELVMKNYENNRKK